MLAVGYMGEAGIMNAWTGFAVGMAAGWLFILFEIFLGEAGKVATSDMRLVHLRSGISTSIG